MTVANGLAGIRMPGAAIQRLMRQVHAEYAEMPGMSLTLAQAQRLWSVDGATCEEAFDRLTVAGVLRRTATGRFVRASAEDSRYVRRHSGARRRVHGSANRSAVARHTY